MFTPGVSSKGVGTLATSVDVESEITGLGNAPLVAVVDGDVKEPLLDISDEERTLPPAGEAGIVVAPVTGVERPPAERLEAWPSGAVVTPVSSVLVDTRAVDMLETVEASLAVGVGPLVSVVDVVVEAALLLL